MIDDFEAVLLANDHPTDDERERPTPHEDDLDGWRADFRSYLDDPE